MNFATFDPPGKIFPTFLDGCLPRCDILFGAADTCVQLASISKSLRFGLTTFVFRVDYFKVDLARTRCHDFGGFVNTFAKVGWNNVFIYKTQVTLS